MTGSAREILERRLEAGDQVQIGETAPVEKSTDIVRSLSGVHGKLGYAVRDYGNLSVVIATGTSKQALHDVPGSTDACQVYAFALQEVGEHINRRRLIPLSIE